MTEIDLAKAAEPDSTQINADDLIGGPQVITITGVRRGNSEQPVEILSKEYPDKAYRPGKSMIRVLIAAWGTKVDDYTGRRLMIYRDPTIRFGKDVVGGIRISAMSHLDQRLTLPLTVTRGRRQQYTVDPLPDSHTPIPESFAGKVRAGGLSDEDRAKAVTYLDKLTDADPSDVAELRALLEVES